MYINKGSCYWVGTVSGDKGYGHLIVDNVRFYILFIFPSYFNKQKHEHLTA